MRKFISAVLAVAMAFSILSGIMIVSAADGYTTFTPSASPGTTTAPTTIETGISCMTLTIGADEWSKSNGTVTAPSGNKYTAYIAGKNNPNIESGTGTYYTFTFDNSFETGALEIAYRHGTKPLYITDNGTPMEGYNGLVVDADINDVSTITVKGGHSYTLYASGSKVRFFGCSFKEVNPQKEFANEIAAFPFDTIKGMNTDINHIDSDLELIQAYESKFGSCDVRWETSNESVIDKNGNVNCQKTETKVTVTGFFSVQEDDTLSESKSFEVTVIADTDDASAVAAAKDALTLGDTSSVKENLILPSEGKRGTTITWKSSNTNVVEDNGTVHRAAGTSQTAVLTATISRGSESATKDFTITVLEYVALTIESYSYANESGNPQFTPTDGGKLMSINVTKCENLAGDDNNIVAAVYANDSTLKDCKMLNIKDLPLDKSTRLEVDLPMNSTDTFKLFAMDIKTLQPYITPYEPNDTVADKATIYVVGDSTASPYGDDQYPRKGWAQMLGGYFEGGVTVKDLAMSGKSSLSLKYETNYKTLKNSIKKGDYLIIQFGHNDQKANDDKNPHRHTEAGLDRFTEGSYKKSMYEYVRLAWDVGAHPILATSISRRSLSDSGLEQYVKDTRELAQELSIPCIDLYAKTNGWINEVGLNAACDMFNYVKPKDSRFVGYANFAKSSFYEQGTTDNTHININGADLIAQWAADSMKDMGIPVTQKMSTHRATYPLPSYADATSVN